MLNVASIWTESYKTVVIAHGASLDQGPKQLQFCGATCERSNWVGEESANRKVYGLKGMGWGVELPSGKGTVR